ncbi:MAG: hypothetical protein R3320_00875 [Nitriliruptorales bacterium]|nr:hypothetical protein [Nitriliruptorales bacterium]
MAKIPDREQYRRQWAELSLKDRRRIVRAVNRGQALERRKEAALAVATARNQQRFWSKAWVMGPIGALFTIGSGWQVYAANAVLLTMIMGAMSWFWIRRARRAEEVNLAAASGKRQQRKPKKKGGEHLPGA